MEIRRVGNAFADALKDRMDELGLNIAQLRDKVGRDRVGNDIISYEHIRKITRGETFPSDWALRALCDTLELDFDEMKRLLDEEKLREKFGDVLDTMTGKAPGLHRVEGLWKKLNREQKDTVIDLLQVMVKRNTTSAKEKADRT